MSGLTNYTKAECGAYNFADAEVNSRDHKQISHHSFPFSEPEKCAGKLTRARVDIDCNCLVCMWLFISTFIWPLLGYRTTLWVPTFFQSAWPITTQTNLLGIRFNSLALENYSSRAHFPGGKRFFSGVPIERRRLSRRPKGEMWGDTHKTGKKFAVRFSLNCFSVFWASTRIIRPHPLLPSFGMNDYKRDGHTGKSIKLRTKWDITAA